MGPESIAVSVVVPCRNERKHITGLIESILDQFGSDSGFELIVADGMSEDGTRGLLQELASKHSRLRVIDNPGRIVSTGLNEAIRAARGKMIIRMDAHTEYSPDYLGQCIEVLKETGADNVGGPWVAKGKDYINRAIAAAFQSRFGIGGARGHDPNYEGPLDTVYLGCWPRSVFDRIGYFDEELVRNQDDELNLRLVRAGGKVWQSPRIKSWYCPRGSLWTLFRQYSQYGYWKVRVIQKHRLPASLRHLVPGAFVSALLGLPVLSPFWAPAGWAWVTLVAIYTLCNLSASAWVAMRQGFDLLPVLPLVFAIYHLAYGFGFLHGILDFVVLHRKAGIRYTSLTRTSTAQVTSDGSKNSGR